MIDNFQAWATAYFGEHVSVPAACEDAWRAGVMAEREVCARLCESVSIECAAAIRARDRDGEAH